MKLFQPKWPRQSSETGRWMFVGRLFQGPMMVLFLLTCYLEWRNPTSAFSLWYIPSYLGVGIYTWCLYWLYFRNLATTKLIVTGPYRWTRHPMYIGLMLMDSALWIGPPWHRSIAFCLTQAAFLFCLMAAAYCQERETIARFGPAAIAYYARTPRIPLGKFRRVTIE